ncbi:nucleotidyltransferase domain-containing protein [Nodosilinea sp. FACHB-141]|uniref:nucleotidyltransferase family protein n=1 Tax=Leptolyngbya subtilissima TaxID=1346803 RepID=UPI0018F0576F
MVLQAAPLDERVKTQRNSILNIAERYGAYDMWVFGSVARGESHQTNDVDFLWRCRQGTAC